MGIKLKPVKDSPPTMKATRGFSSKNINKRALNSVKQLGLLPCPTLRRQDESSHGPCSFQGAPACTSHKNLAAMASPALEQNSFSAAWTLQGYCSIPGVIFIRSQG